MDSEQDVLLVFCRPHVDVMGVGHLISKRSRQDVNPQSKIQQTNDF